MPNDQTRRNFILTSVAAAGLAVARPVFALTSAQAKSLIDRLVAEINAIINSGRSERQMYGDFERIFAKYADVPIIARTTLGPPARSASAAQMRAYTAAFQGYISRKYGRRFREFIGGRIEVVDSRKVKSFFEVKTTALLRGEAPFTVTFFVSDRSGHNLFFDMRIEGISLLKAEKTEVRAMLDRRQGDIDRLIKDLKRGS